MDWSNYQQAIFDAVRNTGDSLLIEAKAGSGKTTTVVEAIQHVPSTQTIAFVAFNKAIAEELKRRVTARNARCMTLHSIGNTAWKQYLSWDAGNCELDNKKTRKIIEELELSSKEQQQFGRYLPRLVSLAKGNALVPSSLLTTAELEIYGGGLCEDSLDVWQDMAEAADLDEDEWNVDLCRMVLAQSIQKAREIIDFDDMLYMPVVARAPFEKFDVVFVDEAQDLNTIQHEIISRMNPSRVICVGDRNQAIYGFRGALYNSMDLLSERFACKHLALSVSYRCPQAVVRRAQAWVKDILWAEDAPEGLVESPAQWGPGEFLPQDAILCRIAWPLIETAFLLLRNKIPAKVMGRDIGQGLAKLVEKLRPVDLEDLLKKMRAYREREARKAKGNEGKIASVDDKLDTLRVFVDESESVSDLLMRIGMMFGEAAEMRGMVTLSTVHKAKGLEWDRVFVLDAQEYMPSPWARQDWQHEQEDNLCYVAATRARRELRYISSEQLRKGEAHASPQPRLTQNA